jgi:predicted peptidase
LPPAILFLSGSGARGPPENATRLAGYDGVGKRVREYNSGIQNDTSNQMAAEEFFVIIPIAPDDVPQDEGPKWDADFLPGIVAAAYQVSPFDLERLYITGYSMGGRGGWWLMIEDPTLFAAGAFAAGSTSANSSQLEPLKNVPIRQYVGSDDEKGPVAESEGTQANMDAIGGDTQTIILPGQDHISMGDVPFNESMFTWLLQQRAATNATLPSPNATGNYGTVPNGVPSASATSATVSPTAVVAKAAGASSNLPLMLGGVVCSLSSALALAVLI